MDLLLEHLSQTVPAADSVEALTRPLLEMLGNVTGLESTYLTTIDLLAGQQHIQYSRNVGAIEIPEGLVVPWHDTLCKRALDEGRMYTGDVGACWGDSDAARALRIQTYVSTPVRTQDGFLLGTLCAASAKQTALPPMAPPLLSLFSKLIGTWIEREKLVSDLRAANEQLASFALCDPLTGLANRRAIVDELGRLLARAKRERSEVLVGMVDLDGFKPVNDAHGHHIGDLFLKEVGRRMADVLRASDLVGRLGGDEFIVLAPAPQRDVSTDCTKALEIARLALRDRIAAATAGAYKFGPLTLNYSGASVGVVAVDPSNVNADEALRLADLQMYETKRERKLRPAAEVRTLGV